MQDNLDFFCNTNNCLNINGIKGRIISHNFICLRNCTKSSINKDICQFRGDIVNKVIPNLPKYNIDCVQVSLDTRSQFYAIYITKPNLIPEIISHPGWWEHIWYVSQDINYENILKAVDDVVSYAVSHQKKPKS